MPIAHKINKGDKFNRLTVIKEVERQIQKRCFNFKCDCGVEKIIKLANVLNGTTKSCGCYNADRIRNGNPNRKTREYGIWGGIKTRCYNKNHKDYIWYGKRGIEMSEEWKNSFDKFYEDMGFAPSKNHSIDRIDSDMGYCKGNCKWSTPKEQCNNKRNNRIIKFNGVSMTLMQWAEHIGLEYETLRSRLLYYGWTVEKALTTKLK